MNLKPADPARVDGWDLQDANGQLQLPAAASFEARVGDRVLPVARVGFKRRPVYAPLRTRDLHVGNWLYLELASPVATGETVQLLVSDARLGATPFTLTATATADRLSPAIHVNQEGYLPDLPKLAWVGAFLGTLGELRLPAATTFELVDDTTGLVQFQGTLGSRPDSGFNTTPLPYQEVLAADFSSVTQPGSYRLRVPGVGSSEVFRIAGDMGALLARTYMLGLYHQRCGTALSLPFTRFTHGLDHTAPAQVPDASFAAVTKALTDMTADVANNPRHTAPRLSNVGACLYPFVSTNEVDVSLGHHDAGDYSKYTINSAGMIHHLVFAADAFPGVAGLDNLGLPESGDGRSDVLQEAKWEADFLAKMQDADGGFYFLVYPRDRKYEDNVLPENGDPQVVFPKNTSATAAAVAALAQIASSPTFRAQFPTDATRYLAAARRGWDFLERAIAAYGRDGAYQKVSHYGDVFMHDDELAWAAAELFAATGEARFDAELREHYDPSDPATRRWTWWRLYEGYGAATRSYAFAARTGRLPASALDSDYLAKCEAEILAAAEDLRHWGSDSAYGTAFPDASKRQRSAGWYFSIARAFDLVTAQQLQPRAEWLATLASQIDYEVGANPVNQCFLTGLGLQRPTVLVSQYALNDGRSLPPSGFPIGQLQSGFPWLSIYDGELGGLCVPSDGSATNGYPLYDRWGDTWNTSTEAVVVDQARGLATVAFLMAGTSLRTQSWRSVTATIITNAGSTAGTWECTLRAPGLDLSTATIVWETEGKATTSGTNYSLSVTRTGEQWVEAEAQLPDGRRVFAARRFLAAAPPNPALGTVTITAPDAKAAQSPVDLGRFELARTGSLAQPLTVPYAIGGTARNGTHYNWINGTQYSISAGTVVIPAGTNRVVLVVTPKTSQPLTGTVSVIITLTPTNSHNVGLPHQATVEIFPEKPVNHPPSAQNLNLRFGPEVGVSFALSAVDYDGDPLTFTVLTMPAAGTLLGEPPNLIYVPGPAYNGQDQFTYCAWDGELASEIGTVALTRDFTSTIAVFPLNSSLADGLATAPDFAVTGQPLVGAGAVSFRLLDDAVTTVLPASAVKVDDTTAEVVVEARLFVNEFLGYGKNTVPLLRLYRAWNAFIELRQDKWARTAQVRAGTVNVTSTADLAPILTPGVWHHVSLRVTQDAYRVFVDGRLVSDVPTTDLRFWRLNAPVTLVAGHFAGWVDWIEVRVTGLQRPTTALAGCDSL